MSDKLRKLLLKLKNPSGWMLVLTYLLTIIFVVGALLMLLVDYDGTALAVIAYLLFALAAVTLFYSVYTAILFAPRIRRRIIKWAEKYEFTNHLIHNFGFRTVIFAIGSFATSIAFGIFNIVLSVQNVSVWYGVLAGHYILLALMRGGVIVYQKKRRTIFKGSDTNTDDMIRRAKTYRMCGILLIIMDLTLIVAVLQMILIQRTFSYAGWTIYAVAAYAFTKIIMAIVNLFRATRQDDLTVQAIRNINLADAMVSILALQTALLTTFTVGNSINQSYANAITGGAVCLLTLSLGIYMIVKANKKMKVLQAEAKNGTE